MSIPKLTYSGLLVDLADFQPSDVRIADLLAGMSQLRFGAQCPQAYTIADHSWALYDYARQEGCSEATAVCCLTHDLAEAYVGDLHGPIKVIPELAPYRIIEAQVQQAIECALSLKFCDSDRAATSWLDKRMLATELATLWRYCPEEYVKEKLEYVPRAHRSALFDDAIRGLARRAGRL